jgi:hypothetical protein
MRLYLPGRRCEHEALKVVEERRKRGQRKKKKSGARGARGT